MVRPMGSGTSGGGASGRPTRGRTSGAASRQGRHSDPNVIQLNLLDQA